jgi:ribosomal protein S18 acetylase RimI-like enzyme
MLADAARNHRAWFGRGRQRLEIDGVDLFVGRRDAVLAFPDPDADLSRAVRQARASGVSEIGCWSLLPDEALGERLSALGFQDGWQPHWMGVEASRRVDEPGHDVEQSATCALDLPYASEAHESSLGGDVRHFVVRDGTRIVGHAVLNVDGRSAGIYDMGVLAAFRRRGLGRALALAALGYARDRGCASVTLNATSEGEPLYRSVGFESLAYGMTWWHFPRSRGG